MKTISNPVKGIAGAVYHYSSYCLGGDQTQGSLSGNGAKFLTNADRLAQMEFMNLARGFSFNGKEKLVQNAGKEDRQGGWDITFSAPKSLSVLWALSIEANQRLLERIHQRAGHAACNYLEDVAGWSRRGKAGHTLERASLVFASFLHGTSRANDPALHSHRFLFNLGFRPDGTTGALWTQELFRQKMAAGQIYRDALSHMLRTELGLTLEPRKVGFHIQGVPQELCDVFSKRRAQILKAMAEKGVSGAVAAKIAALSTRPPKENVPLHELKSYWARVGREYGFGPEQAEALLLAGLRSLSQEKASAQTQEHERSIVRTETRSDSEGSVGAEDHKHSNNSHQQKQSGDGSRSRSRQSHGSEDSKTKSKQSSKAAKPVSNGWRLADYLFRKRLLFPDAPEWSPLKSLKVTSIELEPEKPFRRWGKIKWSKSMFFAQIRIQQTFLFPNASQFNPLHKVALPSLRVLSPSQLREAQQKREHFKKMEERLSH